MKRIIAVSSVIVIALVIYLINSLIPSLYLNIGRDYYVQKRYKDAYSALKTSYSLNGHDKDCRYYYVQTLTKLPPTLEVQKELFELSQTNLPDSADLIADRQIEKWRNLISHKSGENYIEQVPFNDKILRWDQSKFPLKVAIENDSSVYVPKYYQEQIKKAFMQWQASTGGFMKFVFVSEKPDILVKISPSKNNSCNEENCKYVVAYTTPYVSGELLKQMTIVFNDLNNLKEPFSPREIYSTALHEIGHSLGIMGHSYNKDDLMYMEGNLNKEYEHVRSDFQIISSIDLNTLRLLYRLIPDITNTHLSKFDTSYQFYAPIVMGSSAQINSRKLLEAKNYIEKAPNLPNGYIDLSSAYAEQNEYNSALEALQKALILSYSDAEKYVVYYNFAVIYMNIQDWEESLKYAQLAKETQPQSESSSEIDGLIAGINFNKGNKSFAKNSYISSLERNPGNIVDSVNLATIYLKEFNFIQAGKALSNLINANPEAASDQRVKRFGLLMFFFK